MAAGDSDVGITPQRGFTRFKKVPLTRYHFFQGAVPVWQSGPWVRASTATAFGRTCGDRPSAELGKSRKKVTPAEEGAPNS